MLRILIYLGSPVYLSSLLNMLLVMYLFFSMLISTKAVTMFIRIRSGPAYLFLLNLDSGDFTSDLNMFGLSIFMRKSRGSVIPCNRPTSELFFFLSYKYPAILFYGTCL